MSSKRSYGEIREDLATVKRKRSQMNDERQNVHLRSGGVLTDGQQERLDNLTSGVENLDERIVELEDELRDEIGKMADRPGMRESEDPGPRMRIDESVDTAHLAPHLREARDQALRTLEEHWKASRHRADDSIVFCHPALGTPLDPSKLSTYARKALTKANVPASFRPWHGLRHTALTETAAAGIPGMFVQAKAGHAHGSTTERYLHAHRTSYPDAAELAENRLFSSSEIRSSSLSSDAISTGS